MDTILVQIKDKEIRECLRRILRASPKSRQHIADELTKAVGRNVSLECLNKWASEAESARHLPADCILPLSEILGDDSLQRLILTEKMKRCLRLGEWLDGSAWVIEELNVKLPKEYRIKKSDKSRKSGRPAA